MKYDKYLVCVILLALFFVAIVVPGMLMWIWNTSISPTFDGVHDINLLQSFGLVTLYCLVMLGINSSSQKR